jgi:hypothetical protein
MSKNPNGKAIQGNPHIPVIHSNISPISQDPTDDQVVGRWDYTSASSEAFISGRMVGALGRL